MRQQLDAVDQSRPWTRERRGGIDGDDPLRPQRSQPLTVLADLRRRLGGIEAAGHRDDDLRPRRRQFIA